MLKSKFILLLAFFIILAVSGVSAEENLNESADICTNFENTPIQETEDNAYLEGSDNCANKENSEYTATSSIKTSNSLVVREVVPGSGVVGVPLDAVVRVVFSEDVVWGSGWVRLRDVDRLVDVNVSSDICGNELFIVLMRFLVRGLIIGL